MKIGVTGSTGSLGTLVIQNLLEQNTPSSSIVALARTPSRVKFDVEARHADYDEPATLEEAMVGIDRLLLISGSEPGKRKQQHENVIRAAKAAGVKLFAYTSIFHADNSISPLAPEHIQTEEILTKSGIPYVILRNNWYTENYINDVKFSSQSGIIESAAGGGKVASASRSDYAKAAVHVITHEGHAGKIYELCGDLWDYHELARAASDVTGQKVEYRPVSVDDRRKSLHAAGLPDEIIEFVVSLDVSIKEGALEGSSPDLENLLGHKPESLAFGLHKNIHAVPV